MANKKQVTWQDVDSFIEKVEEKYKGKNITGVYGIPTGGQLLAIRLSKKMGVQWLAAPFPGCIIIDDISDSGEMLLHYANNTSGGGKSRDYHIVTMFYNKSSMVQPEYWEFLKEKDWIVFPWEDPNED